MMKDIRHFFSLKADPFPQEIATADLYRLPSLEPMQQRIRFAISMRSFSLVTGDVGSGKSTSLRYVVDNLAKGTIGTRYNFQKFHRNRKMAV